MKCPTKSLSTLNVPRGKSRLERSPLSQPERYSKTNNTSRPRAARFIPIILVACSNVAPAGQIVQAIEKSQWTSTQVVTAFIKSAVRAQDATNCITEGDWPFRLCSDIFLTRWMPSIVLRRAEDSWRARCSFYRDKGAKGSIARCPNQLQRSQ